MMMFLGRSGRPCVTHSQVHLLAKVLTRHKHIHTHSQANKQGRIVYATNRGERCRPQPATTHGRRTKKKERADAQRAFPAVHVRPFDDHSPWKHRFSRHCLRGNTLLVAAHATFGHASVFNRKPRVPQALGRIQTFGSFCELSVFFGSPASTVSGGRSTRNHTFGSGDPLDS